MGQCQSEVRAAAVSCIHWVSSCHCWFILNLIVDGSIRVEWGQPVQFNSTPSWCSSHGQHAWWGGGCGNSSAGAKVHQEIGSGRHGQNDVNNQQVMTLGARRERDIKVNQ